jgi:catalase
MVTSSSANSVAEQIVDVLQTLAGKHPGFRRAHAKGIVCTGTFVAVPEAKRITKAAHLQGETLDVTLRFSNGSGDPTAPDGAPDVRGLAVKFPLPNGKKTDLVTINNEAFLAGTGEDVLAFFKANLPDPTTGKPDPLAVPRFLETHPGAAGFVGRLMQKPIPASLAQATYYGIHAFRFTSADGSSRFGRYRWIPDAGESHLNPEEGSKRDANFLQTELKARVAKGPATFRLMLQIAEPSDPTNDATVIWPAERRLVELGRLQIKAVSPTSTDDERRLIFDPTKLTEGIELSDDPIPAVRSAAYSVSYERRTKEA